MSLTDGLVGAWCPSLGPSGYTLLDRSGRGNHGTITNAAPTIWKGGSGSWALDFDGTDDHVVTANPLAIPYTGAANVTVSAWIYATGKIGSWRTVFSQGINNPGNIPIYEYGLSNTNKLYFYSVTGGNAFFYGSSSVAINTLYHVAMTQSISGSVLLFLNGRSDASGTRTYTTSSYPTSTFIGTDGTINLNDRSYFQGQISDIGVWNRVLTSAEVWNLYSRGVNGLGRLLTQRAQRRAYRTQGNRRRRLICGAEC